MRTAIGSPVLLLNDAYTIRWGLRLGKAGFLDIVLPARGCRVNPNSDRAYVREDFDQNYWIDLFRTYGATGIRTRVGPAPFLVQTVEQEVSDDGLKVIRLHCETPLSVLSRRINPYDGDDPRSDFPAIAADDFMKAIVRNNYGPNASSHPFAPGYAPDPLRDASALLAVQADATAAAPGYEPDVENAEILRAIQAAADYSYSKNISLFYDIFFTGGAVPFEFRTMINAYATDRTVGANQITIHGDLDLTSYVMTFDWSGSSNRIYAGGRGATGNARIYAQSPINPSAEFTQLSNTVAADPFALREKFESSAADDAAGVQDDAESARIASNTVFRASGNLNENGRYAYGIDIDFGDKIWFVIDGTRFPAYLVSEVGGVQENGSEKLEIGFNTEPLPRAQAPGVAGVISDLSRITVALEKLARLE